MVASSQRLASRVGAELLEQGGTAVDAAIAVNAMLSLIEPHMCGPGGDLFALVWDPVDKRLHGLNASGRAAGNQDFAGLMAKLGTATAISPYSPSSVTTAGAVAGWSALHQRFGKLSLKEIFAPVIAHATQGVTIGPVTANWWQHSAIEVAAAPQLSRKTRGFDAIFLPRQRAPLAGETFNNPALAQTYRSLAANGFDDFYRGRLAASSLAFFDTAGVPIESDDLASCVAQWVEPLTTNYRGYDVVELPPNGQGLSVLQILNMLETFPLDDVEAGGADYWHWFLEAKKLAFEDRAKYFADPDFSDVPVAGLALKAYAHQRADTITAQANQRPTPGEPGLSQGDTTYLTVADSSGMMVSLIQSIFTGFGSGLVAPELGFAWQSRGAGFSLDQSHANVYAAGKRPFHTIIPAFVMRDDEPLMSFGVMGADMQPQGQVQVLANLFDFGMNVQAAGDAPRLRHDSPTSPVLGGHSGAGIVWYEDGIPAAVVAELSARGHDMRPASHPIQHFMGGYQAVARADDGWAGASESRFDGCARGY